MLSMASMREDRNNDKPQVALVKVAPQDEQRLRHLYTTNLAKGVLFLATKKGLPVGQHVRLRLVHPVNEATLDVLAEVENVHRNQDGSIKGCELTFSAFDDDLKEQLFLFVEGVADFEDDDVDLEIDPNDDERLSDSDIESVEADIVSEEEESLAMAKAQAHALLLKALRLEREGNLIEAARLLEKATALDPDEEELWKVLPRVEAKLEAQAMAAVFEAQEAAKAPAISNAPPPGQHDLAPIDATIEEKFMEVDDNVVMSFDEPEDQEPADRRKSRLLFEAARDCYRTQDFDDAINYLENAISADPTYAPTYYALSGMLVEERNDIDRSLFLCRKAVELDPDNEVYQEALASLVKRHSSKE